MKRACDLLLAAAMFAFLTISAPSNAAELQPPGQRVVAATPASYLEVSLQFVLDGEKVFDNNAIVVAGKTGQLTLEKEGTDLAWQLRYTVDTPRKLPSGKQAVDIAVEVLERRNGEWLLRSSPRLGVFPGKAASVGGPVVGKNGVDGSYELGLEVDLIGPEEIKARTGGSLEIKACGKPDDKGSRLQKGGDGDPTDQDMRCCSSECAAGSIMYGYTLYCCGVVWCCDCGTCCSP